MKNIFIFLIIFILINSIYPNVKIAIVDFKHIENFVGYVSDQIVIKFDSDLLSSIDLDKAANEGLTGIIRIDELSQQFNATSLIQRFPNAQLKQYQDKIIDLKGWFKIYFADSIDVELVAQLYKDIPGILDAQPIGIHSVQSQIPNDTDFNRQWHLNQTGDHDIDAPEAWDLETGNDIIIVGVLDTGVRYYHKDLGGSTASSSSPENANGNMWINWSEKNGIEGMDDDSNGYIDDWVGWDFVDDVNPTFPYSPISGEDYEEADNDPRDFNGHGTHCAGNIGAINNNGYATASVSGGWGNGNLTESANGVRVIALRIGYSVNTLIGELGLVRMDFAADALYYAANNSARIVSCSWGSSDSGGLGEAIDYFLASGGLIFKAAGNDNSSTADYMGQRTDTNIIDVAATDSLDRKADFSNYGSWIDISAPGTGIWSSWHDHSDASSDYITSLNGTSMATPIAAGVAALIWSANPNLTSDEVRQILYNNSDNIDSENPSYIGQLGEGRVNAFAPLTDPSLPVTLSSFSARSEEDKILLEWTTQSEIDNLGFELMRKSNLQSEYQLIASYVNEPSLMGLGNSTIGRNYSYKDYDVFTGITYWYKLIDVDINGKRTEHGPISSLLNNNKIERIEENQFFSDFHLFPNYPNPFNPSTKIKFAIPSNQKEVLEIKISIYNILGRKIKILFQGFLPSGIYETEWNGKDESGRIVPSGIYFYSFETQNIKKVNKMMFIR